MQDHLEPAVSEPEQQASTHVVVDQYEKRNVSEHPFFVDLAQRPTDYGAIWLLMTNLQASISYHFVRWLANTIRRLDNENMACLLAKQLNDELGNGDFSQIHSLLLDRFVTGLTPWRLDIANEEALAAGNGLRDKLALIFEDDDPYYAVGALMTSEVFAKKMDACVGDQIRRSNKLSEETLTWLNLHERLEVEHADDSYALAELVPQQDSKLSAVRQGAESTWNALWHFLDQVHATYAKANN
jgi:pyrroloquinoline quinone (PQQ) biosynthesis protein C